MNIKKIMPITSLILLLIPLLQPSIPHSLENSISLLWDRNVMLIKLLRFQWRHMSISSFTATWIFIYTCILWNGNFFCTWFITCNRSKIFHSSFRSIPLFVLFLDMEFQCVISFLLSFLCVRWKKIYCFLRLIEKNVCYPCGEF